jgi:hypothetical protein
VDSAGTGIAGSRAAARSMAADRSRRAGARPKPCLPSSPRRRRAGGREQPHLLLADLTHELSRGRGSRARAAPRSAPLAGDPGRAGGRAPPSYRSRNATSA